MKKAAALIVIIFTAVLSYASDDPRFIIDSGHSGAVTALDYVESEKLIFSAGMDGTVKIWDETGSDLKFQLHVSYMPIRRMAVCDCLDLLAVVESDGINAYNLSVWNWKSGEMLYRQHIREIPLFLRFSPTGSFLVYGKTDWNSLIFIESETGARLPGIAEGFGIVSSVFISSSEKTLLTYSPSGSIQYWDLMSGERKQRFSAPANLENISFLSSGRYMTGNIDNEIYLVDLVSGSITDSVEASGLSAFALDRVSEQLVYISKNGRDISYNTASVGRNGFGSVSSSIARSISAPVDLVSVNGRIFTAHSGSEIYLKTPFSEKPVLFCSDRLLKIDDFAVNSDALAVSSPGKIITIPSEFFFDSITGEPGSEIESSVYPIESRGKFGISAGRGSEFLVWTSESDQGGFIRKFSRENGFGESLTELLAPLLSAGVRDDEILTLNRNGDCRILDYGSGEERFKYSSFGIRVIDFMGPASIIAGRNSSSTLATPLLQINTLTGETVPIEDSNMLTFALSFDELSGKLYTLGFEERGGRMRTVLKEHTGRNHDRTDTIMTFPGRGHRCRFCR